MTDQPDHYYINRVLEGEVNAFSFLVEKYQNMVFTIALKLMKEREEAEDVAQEAFIKCFQSLKKFKGQSKFSTWLYRISYNHCLDKLKEKKRYVRSDHIDEVNESQIDAETDAFYALEQKERKEYIEKALKKLSEDDQLLMTLYYYEELSLKEISEITGIKANNIKIKLYRSRNKLLSLLKDSATLFK
ncbi:sigma-70 family RNA polymerase sigma factor [Leptobacterium flavescens]|uniref:Sigma-70 family RNA polymerase sigma factor n=1 Tax=Leptobacterium flavescens TaxID=472055 RepID=A0A6P0UK02_9FLAO|nr:sigma-70 family RNA polymerase sigma factor [Leptobacterium flavescens]NER12199.1 sigma-70 family RNA polymerase sigma factor [Leptobacterium flavescens]